MRILMQFTLVEILVMLFNIQDNIFIMCMIFSIMSDTGKDVMLCIYVYLLSIILSKSYFKYYLEY